MKERIIPPLLSGYDVCAKRAELKLYFKKIWSTYDNLFSLINSDEAYYLRPEPLRHPLIFYFGHTATFYINKLILGKFISKRVNSKLEAICAVGVDEMSWDDLNSTHYNWPSVSEIKDYRVQVASLINHLIDTMPLSLPIKQNSLAWVILMGCEHECIHIETSSVIMRMLPLYYLTANKYWSTCDDIGIPPTNELLPVCSERIRFGKPTSDDTYGWDNEYGHAEITVKNFKTSKYLVSNEEFLAFVNDKGYLRSDFWTDEGKQWLAFSKAVMPRFWFKKGNKYWQRNFLNEIPLPKNWPVEVNYLEAKAFCDWKTKQSSHMIRLPTEAEWLCLRNKVEGDLPTWGKPPGNINGELFASSCPVDCFENEGFYDIVGNVWQWTESTMDGFNGFSVHPLYDDFSTPTFDGKHNLIKGGSWISMGNEAIKHSRYAFRRHFFQHAGFRYVESDTEELPNLELNHYENEVDICQQLDGHYGDAKSVMPVVVKNYSVQIADKVVDCIEKYEIENSLCLDLGCSVGRVSFILAQYFKQIYGIDFSARYIQHGVNLQQSKSVKYVIEKEGDILDYNEINLENLGIATASNLQFFQGDPCNLKTIFTAYNVIIAQHILEKSYDPSLFLKDIHQRLKTNGLLIIISTYTFNEQISDKSKWLGGVKINGENISGIDGLTLLLQNKFDLLEQHQLTKVLKNNQRNFSLSFPQLTVWQLKA